MDRHEQLITKLADVFRRIRGEYDPAADRYNYGSSLQDVEKFLTEVERDFPEIVRAGPQRCGE